MFVLRCAHLCRRATGSFGTRTRSQPDFAVLFLRDFKFFLHPTMWETFPELYICCTHPSWKTRDLQHTEQSHYLTASSLGNRTAEVDHLPRTYSGSPLVIVPCYRVSRIEMYQDSMGEGGYDRRRTDLFILHLF